MLRKLKGGRSSGSAQLMTDDNSNFIIDDNDKRNSPQDAITKKDSLLFHNALKDPDLVERVRVMIKDAHVFKLPVRKSVSIGYRGAEWTEKVWQGTIKVIERGEHCGIVLIDPSNGSTFAICPYKEGAVERCIDSSRYFVLRIENEKGNHMFIGVAFNERNDAFDFNTSLEDSKRERETESKPFVPYTGPTKDYSIKEGQKIRVSIPKKKEKERDEKTSGETFGGDAKNKPRKLTERPPPTEDSSLMSRFIPSILGGTDASSTPIKKQSSAPSSGFLAPPTRDTPSRTMPTSSSATTTSSKKTAALSKLSTRSSNQNGRINK